MRRSRVSSGTCVSIVGCWYARRQWSGTIAVSRPLGVVAERPVHIVEPMRGPASCFVACVGCCCRGGVFMVGGCVARGRPLCPRSPYGCVGSVVGSQNTAATGAGIGSTWPSMVLLVRSELLCPPGAWGLPLASRCRVSELTSSLLPSLPSFVGRCWLRGGGRPSLVSA